MSIFLKNRILAIDPRTGEVIKAYTTGKELAEDGYTLTNVHRACKNPEFKHQGVKFRYEGQITKVLPYQGEPTNSFWEENKESASLTRQVTERVKSLEDLIRVCEIDTNTWEVESYTCNTWEMGSRSASGPETTTLYQVKAKLSRIKHKVNVDNLINEFKDFIFQGYTFRTHPLDFARPLVVGLADFHIGALTEGLTVAKDYSPEILKEKLAQAADRINQEYGSEVHLMLAGDFIESFSGLNHPDSWQSMAKGYHGAKAVIAAANILASFITKVNNVQSVSLVAGNHDRTSASNKEDTKGQAAEIIFELLKYQLPMVEVNFSPMVLQKTIDGISYILTHGHHRLSQRPIPDIVLDYGKQGLYNVVLQGHFHKNSKREVYRVIESIPIDKAQYCSIILKPMFTGNFYSESIGLSTTTGMELLQVNKFGKLEICSVQI